MKPMSTSIFIHLEVFSTSAVALLPLRLSHFVYLTAFCFKIHLFIFTH